MIKMCHKCKKMSMMIINYAGHRICADCGHLISDNQFKKLISYYLSQTAKAMGKNEDREIMKALRK